jgi:hypothetical protein
MNYDDSTFACTKDFQIVMVHIRVTVVSSSLFIFCGFNFRRYRGWLCGSNDKKWASGQYTPYSVTAAAASRVRCEKVRSKMQVEFWTWKGMFGFGSTRTLRAKTSIKGPFACSILKP